MKKLILGIVLAVLLIGCQFEPPSPPSLSPPPWILGTWSDVDTRPTWSDPITWIFTVDNAVLTLGTTTNDFKKFSDQGLIVEKITATTYSLEYKWYYYSATHLFQKLDGTAIDYDFDGLVYHLTKI